MERRPEGDPVTDAIEEVTHTLAGTSGQLDGGGPSLEATTEHTPIRLEALSRAVNMEARRRYADVARRLDIDTLVTSVATRLALRMETPYPYSFTEDDSMFPSGGEAFGRIIRRGREEGLKEIHSTIGEQDKEHNWLFIPEIGIWIDNTMAAEEATVDPDQYVHIFLTHLYRQVETVHTHPDIAVRNIAKNNPWEYSRNYLLEGAQPSSNDLTRHCQMVSRASPDCRQVSSVVSHHGVTSFGMTGDLRTFRGFQAKAYERRAPDATDPIATIRDLVSKMNASITRFDGSPAIHAEFHPIPRS